MQVNSIKSRSMCGNSGVRSAPEKRLPHSKFRALARFRNGLSERHSQRKLQLPWRIRSCRSHEISWHLVISWEVIDSNVLSATVKARRVTHDAVISELKATVQPIEKVERLGGEIQFDAPPHINPPRNPHICGGVIRSQERIPARRRQAVIAGVVILIGIADHGCIHRAPATCSDDP